MRVKPFADEDGFTTFSNYLLDVIMPSLPANAWKVLCFVLRKTRGWNKDMDRLSYGQIEAGAGIGSSATVSSAIKVLLDKNLIVKVPGSAWAPMGYRINSALEIEVLDDSTSEINALEIEAHSTSEIEAHSTSETKDTERKNLKKDKTKGESDPLFHPMFAAIAAACQIDLKLCTNAQRQQVAQTAKALRKVGKLPEDVPKVEAWWYVGDWRGKRGDPPRPAQIQEVWTRALENRTNGTHQNHRSAYRNGRPDPPSRAAELKEYLASIPKYDDDD